MSMLHAPQHGVDGWVLVSYDRNESRGVGEFVYERGPETVEIERPQPQYPHHEGWDEMVRRGERRGRN